MINTQLNYMSILTGSRAGDDIFSYVNKKAEIPAKSVHQSMQKDLLDRRQEIADSNSIQRDMRAFKNAVDNATSLQEALSDPTVHKIMSAIYEVDILSKSPAQFARIMSTDPDDPNSLLGRTRDKGMIAMGKDFGLAGDPLALMRDAEYQDAIKNTIVSIEFETVAGRTSQAAADAFYFERKAGELKEPLDILANPRIRDLVYTALGFTDQDKAKPLAQQVAKLQGAIDFDSFQNDAQVREFAVQFLNQNDRQQGSTNSALAILGASGTNGGLVNILS